MPVSFKAMICAASIGIAAATDLAGPALAGGVDLAEIVANGGCPGCDLSLAEMRGLSLPGADFTKADLREATAGKTMISVEIVRDRKRRKITVRFEAQPPGGSAV